MDYTTLRQFADSWGLLAMTLFFLFVVFYAFRPGSKSIADTSASIPFMAEDTPNISLSGDNAMDLSLRAGRNGSISLKTESAGSSAINAAAAGSRLTKDDAND